MSGTELIMGMGEVINYLKDLESENKKLKEENKELKEEVELKKDAWCPELLFKDLFENTNYEPTHTIIQYIQMIEEEKKKLKAKNEDFEAMMIDAEAEDQGRDNTIASLEEENKKLKEQNECVKRQIESVCKANDKLKEEEEMKLSAVEALKFMEHKWDEKEKEWVSEEEYEDRYGEEENTKYDLDDWAYGYGFTVKDGEYRINMAGGGDHWEDYVINKDGCFIHNGCGESQVRTFISSPEGSYVKAVFLADPEYKLDEGETDMYEMVQECFIEEIMEYEKQEDKIPTDSDEEPDSP